MGYILAAVDKCNVAKRVTRFLGVPWCGFGYIGGVEIRVVGWDI